MTKLLEVQHINCRYDAKVIISDLSFSVKSAQIISLLGPSGCGKTTVLRAIAGLEKIYAGSIALNGASLSTREQVLPPESRQIGMVFQDYALFPHMSVSANIGFGLHHLPAGDRKAQVRQLLTMIKMEDYADVFPHQLSGGQQQRVALARALAPNPKVLLLDEPFSNLDTELRRSLSLEVRGILKTRGISAILVTHDQNEAFNMADEIGVIHRGDMQQWGTPQALFNAPSNQFVASFICNGKFIPGEVSGTGRARTPFGETTVTNINHLPPGTPLNILVRPWDLAAMEDGPCQGEIIQQQFSGAVSASTLRLGNGIILESNDKSLAAFPPGTLLNLGLNDSPLLGFSAA